MTSEHRVRSQPCEFCPYREDVPSGVWAAHEYEKLVEYDKPTYDQPPMPFGCHATPEFYCHGWAVCHSNRGHAFALLALRFVEMSTGAEVEIPEPAVPLFESGADAAFHGMADIERPSEEAVAAYDKLQDRYPRLRQENE